jgi:hypothetical protein
MDLDRFGIAIGGIVAAYLHAMPNLDAKAALTVFSVGCGCIGILSS